MARAKVVDVPLLPGAITDDTELAGALHAVDMDKVRTRLKRWETIKGWTAYNASGMTAGTPRGVHCYSDLDGNVIVVAASESAVNAWTGGTRYDITPKWVDLWIGRAGFGASNPPLTLSRGSSLVELYWDIFDPATGTSVLALHNLVVGDQITISGAIRESGTINLNGTFTLTAVTPFTVTFDAGSGSDWIGAAPLIVTVPFRAGRVTGTGNTISTHPRIYSIDNFGEDVVFCGSDGTPVFYWAPHTSATNLVTNGTFSSASNWTVSGGTWSISGGTATHTGAVPDDMFQDISAVLEGGKTYNMSFAVTVRQANVNAFAVKIDTINIFPAWGGTFAATSAAVQTYNFRFVCPASPQNLIFTAGANAASNDQLSIDNVSIAHTTIANAIPSAPQKCLSLFVDGNRILNILGTNEADGDFNAMLLRWSDIDNYHIWIPDTDNLAGEMPLGKGSRLVVGRAVGERNLILSDEAAYAAAFTGNGYSVRLISTGCGAVGERSLTVYDNRAFWASQNGFFGYDGASAVPILCPVKDRYVGKLAQYQENKVHTWLNGEYGEVWIHYPHTSDGTEISRYLVYSLGEEGNPWCFGTWNRTCMTRSGPHTFPIGLDTTGAIWSHETGTSFAGSGIVIPFIETGYTTMPGADQWIGCRRYYLDVEGQVGDMTFTIAGRRSPQGTGATQTRGPLTMSVDQKKLDFLLRSRQIKCKWNSSSTTTNWRLGVVGFEMLVNKERR